MGSGQCGWLPQSRTYERAMGRWLQQSRTYERAMGNLQRGWLTQSRTDECAAESIYAQPATKPLSSDSLQQRDDGAS